MNKADRSEELRELIRMLERKLVGFEESQTQCCGVTMAQCHALVEIGRAGVISLNKLAEILNLDKSTMSRTVTNLVNSYLAERVIDERDRRYVAITLTDSGRKRFADIEDGMNLYYKRVFEAMPANKQEQVLESLAVLLEAVTKERG